MFLYFKNHLIDTYSPWLYSHQAHILKECAKKNPVLIKLGNKVRELRKMKNLSQEAFADEVGLDRTYVGGIERGERNIATLNLIRIAIALNVEVGQLFPSIESLKTQLDSMN